MRCPFCGYKETKVTNKRDNEGETRRRRECLKCKKRFTSHERIEADFRVIKKDNTREDFDLEKIKRGITRACEKRPISLAQINKAVEEIENKLKASNKKEIKAETIGEVVMKTLKKLDKIAYIRFASVYKDFKDVSDFKKEIKDL